MQESFSLAGELGRALSILWDGRRRIFAFAVIGAVCAALVSLVVPNVYRSRASFLSTQQEGNSLASSLAAAAGAAIPGGLLSTPATSVDLFREVLESRTVRSAVVEDLNLIERYGIEESDPELAKREAMSALQGQVRVAQKKSGLLAVEVDVASPWMPFLDAEARESARLLSSEIANAMVRQLNQILQERRASSARNSRLYLEAQLERNKQQLEAASDSLVAFQKRHATLSIDGQAQVTVQMLGTLQGEIVAKEIELDVIGRSRTQGSFEYQRVQTELEALERRYNELLRGEGVVSGNEGFSSLAGGSSLPDVAMELLRRTREVELQHTVNGLLTTQYYQARLEEARDTPSVEVLDEAIPPLGKESPKRKIIVILAFTAGIVLSAAVELLRRKSESTLPLKIGASGATQDVG